MGGSDQAVGEFGREKFDDGRLQMAQKHQPRLIEVDFVAAVTFR